MKVPNNEAESISEGVFERVFILRITERVFQSKNSERVESIGAAKLTTVEFN